VKGEVGFGFEANVPVVERVSKSVFVFVADSKCTLGSTLLVYIFSYSSTFLRLRDSLKLSHALADVFAFDPFL
jgi:hypothetical protein